MADRFPSLDEFDAGQTAVNPNAGGEGSSFLDRERAALGEDAAQFASPHDTKLSTTVEDAGDDDLLGGGNDDFHDAGEMAGFESSFPEIDNTNDHMASGGTITGATSYPPPSYAEPAEEPDVIKAWREKRNIDIERRDQVSAERKATTVGEARQAIDDFYESYNDKRDKSVAQTRKEADAFLASRDDTTAGGTSWERIGKLVDLSGKGMKGGAAGTGKERFRELLISLRKDEKAPGATGL